MAWRPAAATGGKARGGIAGGHGKTGAGCVRGLLRQSVERAFATGSGDEGRAYVGRQFEGGGEQVGEFGGRAAFVGLDFLEHGKRAVGPHGRFALREAQCGAPLLKPFAERVRFCHQANRSESPKRAVVARKLSLDGRVPPFVSPL